MNEKNVFRIFHFISESDLLTHLSPTDFSLPSLESEGFIHCSTLGQVVDVANFLAPYDEEMQLLEIDTSKVKPEVRFEDAMKDGRLFPHIYGPLNRDAIVAIHHLEWDGEDGYRLPAELRNDLD
jgi:uncharacterized protein (DUF952 family)